jgi:U2 small nuclear ribonucleoprotein B''
MKMRGQAHIVYRDIQTATQAMRALQGFNFFGMDMVGASRSKALQLRDAANVFPRQHIQYAKTKSDTIAKLDGTFHKPAAAAGAVTSTELQQSIFNAPPSASAAATITRTGGATTLKPPGTSGDQIMEDARSPASMAGQKRRRDEEEDEDEDEDEEGSEGEAAMEEDSDDE